MRFWLWRCRRLSPPHTLPNLLQMAAHTLIAFRISIEVPENADARQRACDRRKAHSENRQQWSEGIFVAQNHVKDRSNKCRQDQPRQPKLDSSVDLVVLGASFVIILLLMRDPGPQQEPRCAIWIPLGLCVLARILARVQRIPQLTQRPRHPLIA